MIWQRSVVAKEKVRTIEVTEDNRYNEYLWVRMRLILMAIGSLLALPQ